jgi:hypothetical protein
VRGVLGDRHPYRDLKISKSQMKGEETAQAYDMACLQQATDPFALIEGHPQAKKEGFLCCSLALLPLKPFKNAFRNETPVRRCRFVVSRSASR